MLNLEAKIVLKKWEFGLVSVYKDQNGKILTKEFGSTYLCNRLSHRQLGGWEGSYRCSHLRFPFCTTCTAVLVMDDDDCAVRTYDCFMPHCRRVMEDLQWFYASL